MYHSLDVAMPVVFVCCCKEAALSCPYAGRGGNNAVRIYHMIHPYMDERARTIKRLFGCKRYNLMNLEGHYKEGKGRITEGRILISLDLRLRFKTKI